jgi:4-amino-4-deoxy-L-arabinose transferase-like glycosyltransferase
MDSTQGDARLTAQLKDRYAPEARPSPASPRLLPSTRRGWQFVGVVVGVAFVLRVAVVLATRHSYHPLNDAVSYDFIANSMAHGHGYGNTLIVPAAGASSYRAPMYPAVLAIAYAIFGHSITIGRLEQAVIGSAFVVMVGIVATQLWSRREGAVAMAIAAVHPTFILYGSGLQLEPLLMTLSMSTLAAALQHRRHPRGLLWPAVAGLLLGLALLTRELAAALVLPVGWLLLTAGRPRSSDARRWGRAALAAPAAFLVVIHVSHVPWTVRNELRLHSFQPVSTSQGYTLAGTYNNSSLHNQTWPALWIPPYYDPTLGKLLLTRPHPSEVWTDEVTRSAAITFIKHHPSYLAKVAYWNTVRLFDLDGTKAALFDAQFLPYPRALTVAAVFASYLLELLAVVALFLRRTWTAPRVVWLIPILAFVPIALISGFLRYRASIEPFTLLLATVTVVHYAERLELFPPRPEDQVGRSQDRVEAMA